MALPGTRLWRAERRRRVAEAEFAATRAEARREALGRYTALSSSYENSSRSRLRPGPRPPGGSGQAHRDRASRENLRRDCQHAYRNNAVARAIVDRKVELVIGGGPVLQVRSEDSDFNIVAERMFSEWAQACDLAERASLTAMAEQAVAAWHTDGRQVWLLVEGRGGEGVLQAIEDERLHNPGNRADGPEFVAGVELDSEGRPVGYHVADWVRDGSFASTHTTLYQPRHVVDLASPRCRVANVLAPEPVLAPVLDLLEYVDECMESTTHAYRIATLFGAIITSQHPGDLQAALIGGNQESDYTGAHSGDPAEMELQPAAVMHAGHGDAVSQLKPEHPVTGADAWLWMLVQHAAAVAGLPIDLTHFIMDRNWSGTRSRLAMAWRALQSEQRALSCSLARVSRWKIAEWITDGRLWPTPGWDRHTWVPAAMPMLDPAQELKTRREAIDARLMDYQRALDETGGGDFSEVARRLGAQMQVLRELGIDPVVPGRTDAGARPGDESPAGKPVETGA